MTKQAYDEVLAGQKPPEWFKNLLAHELCHLLYGLGHERAPSSTMYPDQNLTAVETMQANGGRAKIFLRDALRLIRIAAPEYVTKELFEPALSFPEIRRHLLAGTLP